MDKIQYIAQVVENSTDFASIGKDLRDAGYAAVFANEQPMPPHYKVGEYTIVNRKYVDLGGDDILIGDVVIGKQ